MKKSTYHIFFNTLANPLRMNIILSLNGREKSVTGLSKELKIEQSKISHALALLRCCNVVKAKQKGKERIYFLNKDTIIPMLKLIEKHASVHCETCSACKK
jgi:DNA-binding transcriptional ArsR family regulator